MLITQFFWVWATKCDPTVPKSAVKPVNSNKNKLNSKIS